MNFKQLPSTPQKGASGDDYTGAEVSHKQFSNDCGKVLSKVIGIAVATLNDSNKNLAPIFKPMRSQIEPMGACSSDFSRALSKLKVIARNSKRFTRCSAGKTDLGLSTVS